MSLASLVLGVLGLPTLGIMLNPVGLDTSWFLSARDLLVQMTPWLLATSIAGIVVGLLALRKARQKPHEYRGRGLAKAGIVTSAVPLLIFFAAFPRRAGPGSSALEPGVIGDIRTVIEGEAAYRSANGGLYGPLECLSAPDRCIPSYPLASPTFLDSQIASLQPKGQYERSFHPSPAPNSQAILGASPSGFKSFAYVAVPVKRQPMARRGFCGDSSGRICFTTNGTAPPIVDGLCSPSCTTLR